MYDLFYSPKLGEDTVLLPLGEIHQRWKPVHTVIHDPWAFVTKAMSINK